MFGCGTAGAGSKAPPGNTRLELGAVGAIVFRVLLTKWSVSRILPLSHRRQTPEDDRLDRLGDALGVDLAARPVPLDHGVGHPKHEAGRKAGIEIRPDLARPLRL